VAAGTPAWAARPLITEDTGTLDPGQVELELGVDYTRDGRSHLFLLPGGPVLNVGLLPRLEGAIGTALVLSDSGAGPTHAGAADLQARVKYRFVDESPSVPALMGAVVMRFPTGDETRGLGDPGVDVQPLAVASKTFGAVTITVNAGYTFVTHDRTLDVVNLETSAEVRMSEAWTLVGEVVSELATSRDVRDSAIVRAGVVYALGQRLKLDAAVAVGVTRASPDLIVTIGFTYLLRR